MIILDIKKTSSNNKLSITFIHTIQNILNFQSDTIYHIVCNERFLSSYRKTLFSIVGGHDIDAKQFILSEVPRESKFIILSCGTHEDRKQSAIRLWS